MSHPNGAVALEELQVCVAEPESVAQRYARYFGTHANRDGNKWLFELCDGKFVLTDRDALLSEYDIEAPVLPFASLVKIRTREIEDTRMFLKQNGIPFNEMKQEIQIPASETAGATIIFIE